MAMTIRRVVPNITTQRIEESVAFYTELFGFRVAMDMDWIVTLASPSDPAVQISFVRGEAPAPATEQVTLTIEVADVDQVHARAAARGDRVVYPLTDESWGVRRFHVRDPNDVVINVMSHAT